MFGQLQQLSQQLVNQQQMFQQSLEMQRQQSQAQMETLTNLGAAQVAKTTYDARDSQTKSVFQDERFKGDEKAWPDWREVSCRGFKCFRQAAAILHWAEDRYDQSTSESDIQQVAARENWADMVNFNMQLHGDLVSLMEEKHQDWCGARCIETTQSQVRSSQPIEKYTVAGEVARAVASWLFGRGCKHGESRARAAKSSPKIWKWKWKWILMEVSRLRSGRLSRQKNYPFNAAWTSECSWRATVAPAGWTSSGLRAPHTGGWAGGPETNGVHPENLSEDPP